MTTIYDLISEGKSRVVTVGKGKTVYFAIALMVENNIGSLVVVENGAVAGIITERDYLKQVTLKGKSSRTTKVEDIMTTDLIYVEPDTSFEEAMAIMTEKRFRHLPVLKNGGLIGLVSIGDLVKDVVADQKAEINYLTEYLAGAYPG